MAVRKNTRQAPVAPSLERMQEAVREFLRAAGLDPAADPQLAQTPELTAKAWAEEFLDGYRSDPSEVLGERMPAGDRPSGELVVLAKVSFQSVCPHHLLPYGGLAHVAYQPGRFLIGFGQIARLLDCLGHRLVLQEDLARQVARALSAHLDARGVGVLLEAEQACLTLRGGRRHGARSTAEAWEGAFARDGELRSRFLAAVRG